MFAQETQYFTTSQVAILSTLTLRQLQWCAEKGVLEPQCTMLHSRQYTYRQLVEAGLIAQMRQKLSLQAVRHVLAILRRDVMRRIERRSPLPPDLYLATDGDFTEVDYMDRGKGRTRVKGRVFVGSESAMIDWIKDSRSAVHVIAITEEVERIDERLIEEGFREVPDHRRVAVG
jgi:DNA-binding transcriptional MerR regulator